MPFIEACPVIPFLRRCAYTMKRGERTTEQRDELAPFPFYHLVGAGKTNLSAFAIAPPPRHHLHMGRDRTHQVNRDLFAAGGIKDLSPSAPKHISSSHEGRHVLPKDLPNAVRHLNDEELDRLLVVTLAEAKRRGRHATPTSKRLQNRAPKSALSLTPGQLNAVRAAFKAGITPARIARQFGLSQSDVRKALATGASKGGTGD